MNKESEREQDQKLEQLFDDTLRTLPYQRAPGTLEGRVLDALQRRAIWWRRSFAHWPLPARTAFVVMCAGFVGLAMLAGNWTVLAVGSLSASDALVVFPAHQALGLLSVAALLISVPIRVLSPLWLYSALASGAALYVILFGLGAVAYRTLYLKPLDGR